MNYYLFLTVRVKESGRTGIVVSVDETLGLLVEFPEGVKWIKEDEIDIIG